MGRLPKNNNTEQKINTDNKPFSLNDFKKNKGLSNNIIYKPQTYIPFSEPLKEVLNLEGIPIGHITILRGHSDTGKTTQLIEAAIQAQKMGILPVFIITEMKFNWEHLINMGLEIKPIANEDGEVIDYEYDFLYVDRQSLNSIEDVGNYILDLLGEQKKGNLPKDLLFLWDSVGSIACKKAIELDTSNNQWNAGALANMFGQHINQQLILSRKEGFPYTNTLVVTNKIWVEIGMTPMEQPKLKNKGGEALFSDASLVLTFGGIKNSGTSKLKATKSGKTIEFGKRSKVSCDKNHINGVTGKGTIITTPHGFIKDTKESIDLYKKDHSKEWIKILGSEDFDIIETEEIETDKEN